jgi:hypothetical protein
MNMSEILKADLVDDSKAFNQTTEEERERKKINKITRGYISGFFDAEGMIRLEKDGSPKLTIKQTYGPVLYDISRIFNGTVDKLPPPRDGCKPAFRLRILSDDIIRFLQFIYPNLIEKKRQAELMLYYLKEIKPPRRDYFRVSDTQKQQREWIVRELERLKHEKYGETDYEKELKILNIPKDVREGKQTTLLVLEDLCEELDIEKNCQIQIEDNLISKIRNDVLLGYLTGFFDGEGYVGIQKGKRDNYSFRLAVTNSNYDILNIYKNKYGGDIRPKKDKNKKEYHKNLWLWELFNSDTLQFLEEIYPYTKVKKEQIYYAIKFQEWHDSIRIIKTFEQKKKAEYYRLKLMELKKDIGDDTDNDKHPIRQEQLDKNQTSIDNAWE